jgi:hypothetical protein
MRYVITILLLTLTGCAEMIPGLMTAIDDAVTDEAVSVTVDKAAIQKDTDIKISVEVVNKDERNQN